MPISLIVYNSSSGRIVLLPFVSQCLSPSSYSTFSRSSLLSGIWSQLFNQLLLVWVIPHPPLRTRNIEDILYQSGKGLTKRWYVSCFSAWPKSTTSFAAPGQSCVLVEHSNWSLLVTVISHLLEILARYSSWLHLVAACQSTGGAMPLPARVQEERCHHLPEYRRSMASASLI